MKNTIIAFAALMAFSITSLAQGNMKNIGEDQNGQYKITDMEAVKTQWTKILRDQRNPAELAHFEIRQSVNNQTQKKFYMLLATNEDRSVKMAGTLELKNGVFSIDLSNKDFKTGGIVICAGCKEGCDPEKEGINWVCNSPCGPDCYRGIFLEGQE